MRRARVDGVFTDIADSSVRDRPIDESLLATVIEKSGVDGLRSVVADFAIGRYAGSTRCHPGTRCLWGEASYWAKDEDRPATDVYVLQSLGLASLDLDAEAVRSYLGRFHLDPGRTAYADVSSVPPGRWVSVDLDGRVQGGRWFHPEALLGRPFTQEEAVEETRSAILASVESRSRGGEVGLYLSAGRDSAAIALALEATGVKATCLTQVFEDDLSSTRPERSLRPPVAARWPWLAIGEHAHTTVAGWDLVALARTAGPLGSFAFPQLQLPPIAAAEAGVRIVG